MALAIGGMAVAFSAATARAQLPPTRAFGTVTIDGQPAPLGTVVQATIGDRLCGEGVVRFVNDQLPRGYVVDVLHFASTEGCGVEGATVNFRVGGVAAAETVEYQTGTFVRRDLTVTGQVATPAAGATPPPFGASAASPTPAPALALTVAPVPSPAGGATPIPSTPAAATPTTDPAASPTPEVSATATPEMSATATPGAAAQFTTTPVGQVATNRDGDEGGGSTPIVVIVTLAVLAAAAAIGYTLYRRRGRA